MVNGIYVQPYWTHRFNFYEVLKHATEVRAVWAVNVMVMNRQTYEAMPEALQDAFMLAAKEASDIANKKDWGWEDLYKDKLRKDGMDVYKPSERNTRNVASVANPSGSPTQRNISTRPW